MGIEIPVPLRQCGKAMAELIPLFFSIGPRLIEETL